MQENLERQVIELIATDRIDVPISSMSGKLKRQKPKLAQAVDFDIKRYNGDRVFAYFDNQDHLKSRGTKEGIEKFAEEFPKYGTILRGYIEEQRAVREKYLVFGMNEGCKVTADDYLGVMQNLGFTPATAQSLYPELMDISRKLRNKRDEYKRSILIEQTI
ncbi:hypothetical protein JXB27_04560 [Candidatus Woesearchaeota archaeon]|nr:hypothetical protein [Candidatus Woesearchaeota archaeon]